MATFSTIIFLFVSASAHSAIFAAPIEPATACASTLYPSYCESILPSKSNGTRNLSDYACISVGKSLSTTFTCCDAIDSFLSGSRSTMSRASIAAINDCRYLFDLNDEYLAATNATLNATTSAHGIDDEHDTIRTLLSSVITNQRTCLDGLYVLNDTHIKNGLHDPLSNATTMLYSVALSLFAQASAPKRNRPAGSSPPRPNGGRLLLHEVEYRTGGGLPLKMDRKSREIFERRSGRRLLQAPSSVLVRNVVVVSQDGTGNFTNITDAVNFAPKNSNGTAGYFLIYVTAGVYEEYVSIASSKKYLMMVGDGINRTVVTGNRSVADGWTTFNSATFAVTGQGFVGINMTFRNTAGAIKHQAVALRNGADLSAFSGCSFDAYQDTLYAHSMRQFYADCDVTGTVDFVFGNAAAVLQRCSIRPRLPMRGQSTPVTAQGRTDPSQNTGTVVHDCSVAPAPDLASADFTVRTYLGRPWKEYSRTVVMQSHLDAVVDPAGWLAWSGDFALSTLYYAEYNNSGPGSDTSRRVTWPGYHVINSTDVADDYTVSNFILGDFWLPQTGVPYVGGLF